MLPFRPLGSLSSPNFYGTSDKFRDSRYDVDHHVSEHDRVGSLAVFLCDSDADEWAEEKMALRATLIITMQNLVSGSWAFGIIRIF